MFPIEKPGQSASGEAPSLSPSLSLVPAALVQMGQALQALGAAMGAQASVFMAPKPSLSLPSAAPTVVEVVNEFLLSRARLGRGDRYLRQLRVSLSAFASGRARRPVDAIDLHEVEAWLSRQAWAPSTKRSYARDVQTLFNYAVRRGWLVRSPAAGLELPAPPAPPPGIHTPGQVRQVLEAARQVGPGAARLLALRYFAGLRTAEAERLAEADLGPEVVNVPAAKSKTRRRRVVPIRPCLRAWLALPGGELPLRGAKYRVGEVVRLAGVPWPANVTRHSFCSYHLAAFGSAARTALEAGHSEAVLFACYRELVTSAAAADYWQLRPLPLPPGVPP